ncbi:MAG: FAD:protein FMN transferase [Nitrospiraceae bacterium]|nr:FAD:protein FMN transferase [Nitrospiraceae bacterium]
MKKSTAAFILIMALLAVLPASCKRAGQDKEKIYRKSSILLDTLVTITVVADSPKQANDAIDAAFAEIAKLQKLISFWDPKSEISELGRESGIRPVKVSPETLDLIKDAVYVSKKTGGAFDCTLGPVIKAWNIPYSKKIPSKAVLDAARKLVGYQNIKIDEANSTVFFTKKGMSCDTGGIAKGWAADYAVRVLKAHGIKAGIVADAGDMRVFGKKPDGHGWMVGIQNPRPTGKNGQTIAKIELVNAAISTSGDYERYFIINGVRYSHIIDPRTDYPAHGFESLTMITPRGVWSDGFSKIFVLGPQKGMPLVTALGFNAVAVDSRGKIYYTPGLKGRLIFK